MELLVLGGGILILAALYSHYALLIARWQNDEELYTRLARHLASDFPAALWQGGIWTRGLQRLDPLVLAAPFAFLRGPGAFEVGHVIECVLFCSTALPVFLLGRRSGLPRAYSYVAALLSVVVPWGVVSTSFLTECVAYPAFAWSLYAVWLATCEPSVRHELAALAILAVAAFARTALLALAPMLPLSVLFQTLRCELQGLPWRARARALPRRLWTAHRIVTALTLAVVALYLLSRLGVVLGNETSRLTGSYGVPHLEGLSGLSHRYRYFFSRAAAGTGFVAAAFAVGWLVHALVRADDRRVHGLAIVLLTSVLCLMLTLLEAGPDERYVMYAAIPGALGFMWALRQRVGLPVLLGTVVVVLLTESVSWPQLASTYDYFTYPAAIFYRRVLLNHDEFLPLVHPAPERVMDGALILVALVWVVGVRRTWSRRWLVPLLPAGMIVLAFTQTAYSLRQFASTAGTGAPAALRSWVDRHVPPNANVATVPLSWGLTLGFRPIWREADFWNTSIDRVLYFETAGAAWVPLGVLPYETTIQQGTGRLLPTWSGAGPAPQYLLVPRVSTVTAAFDAVRVQEDPALVLNLVQPRMPLRLNWYLAGVSPEGFIAANGEAVLRVFEGGLMGGRTCATLTLNGPPDFKGTHPYQLSAAGRVLRRGALSAGRATRVTVPVITQPTPHGEEAQVLIAVHGGVLYPNGEVVAARVENVAVARCARGHRSPPSEG